LESIRGNAREPELPRAPSTQDHGYWANSGTKTKITVSERGHVCRDLYTNLKHPKSLGSGPWPRALNPIYFCSRGGSRLMARIYSVTLALGDAPSSWQQPRIMHPSQLPAHRLGGDIALSTMAV
ncbi:MAG: hypothetical protein ACE5KF_03065, partial [Kiloniellaceae bacterium]